jgi:hypothetical protein
MVAFRHAAPARLVTEQLVEFLDQLFEQFDAAFARADRSVVCRIGGCRFTCHTDTPAYSGIVRRGWADCEAPVHADAMASNNGPAGASGNTPASGELRGECRLLAGRAASFGLPPGPVWAEPFYRERSLEAFLSQTRYRVQHAVDLAFWQMFDRTTGRGIQLSDPIHGLPPWDAGSPLRNFLRWHLASPTRDLIHAGSLGHNGRGILLAGPGGSGKSGTVIAGISHGLETVGDDYVLAEIGPAITVQPLFKTLKQDPAGLARLGLLGHRASAFVNWQGKHQFTLDDLDLGRPPARMLIGALCLPKVTGESRTWFEPATIKEAFLAVAPSGVSQIPGDRGAMFGFTAELARRLPVYRLWLGTEPAEIASSIQRFLGELPT